MMETEKLRHALTKAGYSALVIVSGACLAFLFLSIGADPIRTLPSFSGRVQNVADLFPDSLAVWPSQDSAGAPERGRATGTSETDKVDRASDKFKRVEDRGGRRPAPYGVPQPGAVPVPDRQTRAPTATPPSDRHLLLDKVVTKRGRTILYAADVRTGYLYVGELKAEGSVFTTAWSIQKTTSGFVQLPVGDTFLTTMSAAHARRLQKGLRLRAQPPVSLSGGGR